MKHAPIFAIMILLVSIAVPACSSSTPTEVVPQVQATTTAEPSVETATIAPTATPTAIPLPSPTPTTAPLQLEILQSQTWTDRDDNVRVNVLMRNPYDFPVQLKSRARANLLNGAGEFMRDQTLYFLDGISGGNGFIRQILRIRCSYCRRRSWHPQWNRSW